MSDDLLTPDFGESTPQPTTQAKILPARSIDFLRTKPRKPGSVRGARRDWNVIPGIGYQLDIPDIAVTFDVSRVRSKFDEIVGLLTVRAKFAGAKVVYDNILSSGDFNFSSVSHRTQRAKELAVRACADEIDWRGLIEELAIKVINYEERGEPEIALADVQIPAHEYDPEVLAAGMPLLRRHPVIWFGDGGAAKSMLALYAAIALAEDGVRVLYCDWELDAGQHAIRVKQLIGSSQSIRDTLFYRRCSRPFVDDILPIRDIITKRRIQFLICDSLSFGAKPPIESSESALAYQQALRECGNIGSLHIAHMNRSDQGDKRPFGSVYWHNMARSTWFFQRAKENAPAEVTVGCYHRKANLTQERAPFALNLQFSKERIVVGPGRLDADADMVQKLNLVEKIALALRQGPLTEVALAEETGGKVESITRHLRAHRDKFERVTGTDGISRIRLCV